MRKLTKLVTGLAAAATVAAVFAAPATADPLGNNGKPVTPHTYDVVGVGSDSIQYVMDALAGAYNKTQKIHNSSHPFFYSWDATKPGTVNPGGKIATKAFCSPILRPDGSTAGVQAMDQNARTKNTTGATHFCIDYGRSSGGRSPSFPPDRKGGVRFIALAKDAVTYATRGGSFGGTNAPANLTTAQLTGIYTCTITNWSAVGGKNGTIVPVLPQTGSGTRSFFLKAINVTTPGTCVNSSVQENEGTNKLLNSPNVLVPYSVGSYLTQKFRSPVCGKRPGPGQNKFGCNADGVLVLNKLNGTAPTTGAGKAQVTNPHFTATFIRTLYDVVRYWVPSADHIPPYLERWFASSHAKVKGWFCTTGTARATIRAYGFMVDPFCGIGS